MSEGREERFQIPSRAQHSPFSLPFYCTLLLFQSMTIRSHIAVIEPLESIPSPSPPTTNGDSSTSTSNLSSELSSYHESRSNLLQSEFNHRYDAQKRSNLTPAEALADEKLEQFRQKENQRFGQMEVKEISILEWDSRELRN